MFIVRGRKLMTKLKKETKKTKVFPVKLKDSIFTSVKDQGARCGLFGI